MIEEGDLKTSDRLYIIIACSSKIEVGKISIKYGKFNAATNEFYINIKGRSAHAAYPEKKISGFNSCFRSYNYSFTDISKQKCFTTGFGCAYIGSNSWRHQKQHNRRRSCHVGTLRNTYSGDEVTPKVELQR